MFYVKLLIMKIYLGRSLKGHDKNHVYVIYEETDDGYYLVNGTTKTVSKPKKKNKIHVQLIKNLPESVEAILRTVESIDDETARKVVDTYNRYIDSK